jgi:hypothetical protein
MSGAVARSRRESLRPALRLLGRQRKLVKWAVGFGLASEGLLVVAGSLAAYLVGAAIAGASTSGLVPWVEPWP